MARRPVNVIDISRRMTIIALLHSNSSIFTKVILHLEVAVLCFRNHLLDIR